MTLLEVLLTLCLLVILASLTWPAVGRPMARQRLREGADQVRAAWVKARVEAMSSGRLHVFRVMPEGNGYSVEVQASEDDSANAAQPGGIEAAAATGDPTAQRPSQSRRLPDKVRFAAGQTASDPRTATAAASAPASADPAAAATLGPAPVDPIYFFPDGSCSNAQVRLENEYQQTVDLALRGLTGVVTLGQVQSGEARSP